MKECCRCENYKAFYTKANSSFERLEYGYCSQHERITAMHETCKQWAANVIVRRSRKKICVKALDDALINIAEMKQILFEEYQDNLVEPILGC